MEILKDQVENLANFLNRNSQAKIDPKLFLSCPQLQNYREQVNNKCLNLSFSNNEQDTGYFNNIKNQDVSYMSQGFQGKETLIFLTSRPMSSHKQILAREQMNDSVQELSEKQQNEKLQQSNRLEMISFSENPMSRSCGKQNIATSIFQQKKRHDEENMSQKRINENKIQNIFQNQNNQNNNKKINIYEYCQDSSPFIKQKNTTLKYVNSVYEYGGNSNNKNTGISIQQFDTHQDNLYDKRTSIKYHLQQNPNNQKKQKSKMQKNNEPSNNQELRNRTPSIFYKRCKSMDNQNQKQNKINVFNQMEQVKEEQSLNDESHGNLQNTFNSRSYKDSEYASNLNLALKNIPNIYQVFFNFFPEGIIFMDYEMNIVYSNKSSLLLLDCSDINQLKEAISNLPNLKSEINQTYFGNEMHLDANKNKASFDSFRNLTLASVHQMHEQNNFNNQYVSNYQSNNTLDKSNFSHQIPTFNSDDSSKKAYFKTPMGLLTNHQRITQFNENNSYQSNKIDKSSNQQYLLYEIQKNLIKTQQLITQNRFDNPETNMILNETIVIRSKLKKVDSSTTPKSNTQHQSNSFGFIQHQANLNQNNSIASIKNQSFNSNNINNGNSNNSPNVTYINNLYPVNNSSPVITTSNQYTVQKERTNSFQMGPIQSSIYTSTFSNNNNNLNPTSPLSFQMNGNHVHQSQIHQASNNLTSSYNINQSNNIINQNQLTQQSTASPRRNQITKSNGQYNINQPSAVGYYNIYSPSFINFQISQQCIDKTNSPNQEPPSEQRDFDISLFPSIIEGKPMVLLMVRDVTHRKYIQHLKYANLQKQQIVSYLSHELRNPLNCIINVLDTADYDIQALKKVQQNQVDIAEIQNNIATALQNSKYILNLSNDYLDMARIKADQFKLNIQPFNLLNLLNDCIKLFSIQAYKVNTEIILRNKQIQNSFYVDSTNQFKNIIYSDQERIKQVVINLISNALKFTHNGRIFIYSEYGSINSVQVSIKDTGIGIEKSKLKQLFKAFGKIDDEETQNYNQQGVGLGLLISNMLSIQLGKPPAIENVNPQNNQNINSNSLMNINVSTQSIQQNVKFDKGLKVESEKGIGSTFTLTITDHNPYYKHNKILAKQAIQQIVETQESSALLSQSLYEAHLPKKQKSELDQNANKKLKSNFPNLSNSAKKSYSKIPCFHSESDLESKPQKSYKKLYKDTNQSAEKIQSFPQLDLKNDQSRLPTTQEYKSYCSMTYISLTELQENPSHLRQKLKKKNTFSNQISQPLTKDDNNNKIELKNQNLSNQASFILNNQTANSQFICNNQQIKSNSLANIVKQGPEIKNKFIETSINMENSKINQDFQTLTSFRNFKLQRDLPSLSPKSPFKYQTMITSKYGRQIFNFQGDQIQQRNEQILIVDDNVFCCEALKNIIEKRFGVSCMICYSATKAVEIVKQRFVSFQSPEREKKNFINGFDNLITKEQRQEEQLGKRDEETEQIENSQLDIQDDQLTNEIYDNRFFKFIFLDINMPDVNGFEGLYQIKSFLHQVYPNFSSKCKIVGCSGIDENFLTDQSYTQNNPQAQFDNFLIKPVLKEKLIEFFAAYQINIIN